MKESEIIDILRSILGIGERADSFDRNTLLLGAVPEFDSMAVVAVLTAVEDQYGVIIEDDDVEAADFATVGTLVDFVSRKING